MKYRDSTWVSCLENRLWLARYLLNDRGSIFVRCDYNGNMFVRILMNDIFGTDNFTNEIQINRSKIAREGPSLNRFATATDSIFYYRVNNEKSKFNPTFKLRGRESNWIQMHSPYQYKTNIERTILGKTILPPKGRHWSFTQEKINRLEKEGRIRINEEKIYIDLNGKQIKGMPEYLESEMAPCDSNWSDISGYSQTHGFQTENSEILLKRVIASTSNESDLIMDFFLGSGTTTAVAHKLKRKWIGVEMGEHFWSVVLPRMKKVLAYDKSGISKEKDVKEKYNEKTAGGFFKYHILEQYEDSLDNIELKENKQAQLKFGDDYLLKYFLDYETRENPSLLNIEHLKNPFSYKLKVNLEEVGSSREIKNGISRDGPQEVIVDIP